MNNNFYTSSECEEATEFIDYVDLPDDYEWESEDVDDYASNMPCDNTGMCAGISCSQYFKCQGGK